MSHPLSSTKFVPRSVLRGLRGVLAVLAVTLATHAFGIAAPSHQTPAAPNLLSAPSAVNIQSCATEDIQLGAEVLPWDELQAHDESQTPQAFPSLTREKQAYLEAKSASSAIYTGASSYEIKSAQRYEKVTDTISSFKEQMLRYISLDNGQTIQATAGHPFKTREGWRDAVLLKKGGQLLLGGESDAEDRYASILEIREEVKTTAVFNLEVANLHTFFVGVDGVVVHNGARGPSTDPNAPHNKTIREIGDLIRAAGGRVIAGGGGKERLIPTPCGAKSGRRPDILYTDRLGKERAVNVGKNGRDGQPVTRERQAMSDLNGAGVPTTFIPYN